MYPIGFILEKVPEAMRAPTAVVALFYSAPLGRERMGVVAPWPSIDLVVRAVGIIESGDSRRAMNIVEQVEAHLDQSPFIFAWPTEGEAQKHAAKNAAIYEARVSNRRCVRIPQGNGLSGAYLIPAAIYPDEMKKEGPDM